MGLSDKKKELFADAGCICLPSGDKPAEISWDEDDAVFVVTSDVWQGDQHVIVENRVALDDVASVWKTGSSPNIADAERIEPGKAKKKLTGYLRVRPDAKMMNDYSVGSLARNAASINDIVVALGGGWPDPDY